MSEVAYLEDAQREARISDLVAQMAANRDQHFRFAAWRMIKYELAQRSPEMIRHDFAMSEAA